MEEKNLGGRPRILNPDDKTIALVEGLGQIQATTKECAAVLGVTEPTYLKFKKDFPEVLEAYQAGSGKGLASLRRRQFNMAEKNATMAIWLGKQYLGQADKQEHAGPGGGPIQTFDLTSATDEQLATLESLLGPLAGTAGGPAGAGEGGEGQAAD